MIFNLSLWVTIINSYAEIYLRMYKLWLRANTFKLYVEWMATLDHPSKFILILKQFSDNLTCIGTIQVLNQELIEVDVLT